MSWPHLIALDLGETVEVTLEGATHAITLCDIVHHWAPDRWTADNPEHRVLRSATVTLCVDGGETTLIHRPYQLPAVVGDLRLYIETTRRWATACNLAPLSLDKDVRLSVAPAGRLWGGELLRFPVGAYRWRSASYNNTWSALVPYNLLYYHRGEDFGAIPNRLPVLAVTGGEVIASPVPTVQGSNAVAVRSPEGLTVRYAHMNLETIDPALVVGAQVARGQVLAQTGCTWDGRRAQWADPHLHVSFARSTPAGEVRVSPYPYLVEAYLRDYPDAILPVAGGYTFTTVGQPVTLDATRTVIRDGEELATYTWYLHDGRVSRGPLLAQSYDRPGQYAETLVVRTPAGDEARDYAHVRVYDPAQSPAEARELLAYGWAYASPVRGVAPGTPVTIWNRLVRTEGQVLLDVGDGSPVVPIVDEAVHIYRDPGLYTVTLSGQGAVGEPVVAKLTVVVDAAR